MYFNNTQHPAFHVLTLAIKCTTNYCLKNEEAAKQNMPAFLLQFAHENEDVWLVTLKGVFDLLLEFGLKTFNMTPEMGNESETSNGSFINVLTGLLDHAVSFDIRPFFQYSELIYLNVHRRIRTCEPQRRKACVNFSYTE